MLVGYNHESSMLVSTMRPACGLNPETSMLVSSLEEEYICERNGIAKIYLIILSSGQ